jgi:hypothetical protein
MMLSMENSTNIHEKIADRATGTFKVGNKTR